MQTTYQRIMDFLNAALPLRGQSKAPETKFHYAIDKMRMRITSACKLLERTYNEKNMELQINHASVDDKNNLIMKDDKFDFTKNNWRTYQVEFQKLMDQKLEEVVEVEPYMAAHIPADLSMREVDALAGFILPENYEVPVPEK